MKKVLVIVYKNLLYLVVFILNPFLAILNVDLYTKRNLNQEYSFKERLKLIFSNVFVIFFISAIITLLIIFSIYHKEILGA